MNEGGLSRLYSFKTSEDAGLQSEMGHYEALDALLASQSRDPGGRPLVGSTWEVTVALKSTKQQTSIGDGMIATLANLGGLTRMEGNTTWDRLRWARDEVISTDGAAANQGDTTWDRRRLGP